MCLAGLASVAANVSGAGVPTTSHGVLLELPFLPREASPEQRPGGGAIRPDSLVALDLSTVPGRVEPMLLETLGSGRITPARAKRLSGAKITGTRAEVPSRLGNLAFSIEAPSDPLATVGDVAWLGTAAFAGRVVEIDFPARRLRLLDPALHSVSAKPADTHEAVLDLHVGLGRSWVALPLNDKTVLIQLALGSQCGLVFDRELVIRSGVHPASLLPLAAETRGERGLWLVDLALGPFLLEKTPIVMASAGTSTADGCASNTLGLDILSHFVVRLDYLNKRMSLRSKTAPPRTWLGLPYASTRSAGSFLRRAPGGFEVLGVVPESPAGQLGLLPGDRLLAKDLGTADAREILTRIAASEVLLVRREGETADWLPMLLPLPEATNGGDDSDESNIDPPPTAGSQ